MKTGTGKGKWTSESVCRILRNEKYCGNAILQKTYKRDLLSKRMPNNGEMRKFFVEGGHEAIITPEQFDMAQQELEERKNECRQHSSKSIFASKIVCGCCGGYYGSKVWHSTDKYRTTLWQCNSKFRNEEKCTTPHLKEDRIKEIYLKAVNQLVTEKEPALEVMRSLKAKLDGSEELESELEMAEKELDDTIILFQDYISKNAISEADLADGRYAELEKRYSTQNDKVEGLKDEITHRRRRVASIGMFIEKLAACESTFTEFSEGIWLGLADKIIVKEKNCYIVRFKNGQEIQVED